MKPGGGPALVGLGVAVAALVAVVVVGGHGFPPATACPASGRIIVVDVSVQGDPAAVHDVRLCTTGGCSDPASAAAATGAPAPSDPTAPTSTESPAPVAPVATGAAKTYPAPRLIGFASVTPAAWEFDTLTAYPTRVSATAYGADGRALASREVALTWSRADPGNACDTSLRASPVILHVVP